MTGCRTACVSALAALLTVSCGYHVGAKADTLPPTIRTIAIPPFVSFNARYQLVDELPLQIGREFSSRTRFAIVPKASDADAVLNGNISSAGAFPTIFDPVSGKATSVQILLVLSVKLIDQKTGKVLYERPNWAIREDYQLAVDPHQFFNESGPALDRLSRDVARDLVSGVVENFLTPEQFLARLPKQPPAPIYLFLGQEGYGRGLCKDALIDKLLPADTRAEGFTSVDLDDVTLTQVLDDARSMSLFAQDRLIWVRGAELALPRRLTSAEDEEGAGEKSAVTALKDYLRAPTPGTVVVFECSRYDFTGDDRPRLERVQKFYAPVPVVVEFKHFTPEESRFLAQNLAKQFQIRLGGQELAMLLDAVAGDAGRLASEIEKLALYLGQGQSVTANDLRALVPNSAQSTIFSLVNAVGKGDRVSALRSLDILVREGEYLPLALTFLSTQFRLALAAKEAKVPASQAQAFFSKLGVRMWRDRAEQVMATASAFTRDRLAKAVAAIYETDKKFREGYRDDRVIMETLIFALTAK